MGTDLKGESCFGLVVTEDVFTAVTINEKHSKQWEERKEKSYTSDS